jgi:hypothetical protein
MDGVDANQQLILLKQRYPKHIFILTSTKAVDASDDYFLRKPMVAQHLLDILKKIKGVRPTVRNRQAESDNQNQTSQQQENLSEKSQRIDAKTNKATPQVVEKSIIDFVGKADDVNLRELPASNMLFFKLEDYFVGILRQAYLLAKQQQSLVIITGLWHPITIFPETNQIYIEMSERQIKSICAVTLKASLINTNDVTIKPLSAKEALLVCPRHKNYQTLDRLLWKLALWTAHGRLPQELPLDSPLYLSGWPNLTRLEKIPEVLRICACWVLHPRTIINLTELLDIPQRYIFSIITASYILGMSGLAVRQSDTLILPSDFEPTPKIGLLSRLVMKLRLKG